MLRVSILILSVLVFQAWADEIPSFLGDDLDEESGNQIPEFTINLNLPPQVRFLKVLHHFRDEILFMF